MLQSVLFTNRDALAERGILYPNVSLRGYGHHDFAFLLGGGYPDWATTQPKTLAELGEELAHAVRGHRGSVLLSSEDFYLFPKPEGLLRLLTETGCMDGRSPAIIVYVRRQDEAHESWYNQTVKAQGYTHTVDESLATFHDLFDYRLQLERWAAVFGTDACVVRPFERAQFAAESLLEDFLQLVGLETAEVTVGDVRANTSLNRDALEFARALNCLPLATLEKRRFHRQLIELSASSRGSGLFDETPVLSGRQRAIVESYRAGNAAVAATYLGRETLFFEEPPTEDPAQPYAGLSVEKLASIVGWLLVRGDLQR